MSSEDVPSSCGAVDSPEPRTPVGGQPSPEHTPSPPPTNSWPQRRASCPWAPSVWQSDSQSSSPSSLSPPPTSPTPTVKHKCCSLTGRCVGSWRQLRPRPSAGGGCRRRGEAAETLGGGERPTLRALSVGLGSRRPAGKRGPSFPPGHHSVCSPSAAPSERTGPSGGAADPPPRLSPY